MSGKIYKPEDSDEVYEVLKEYRDKKRYRYKDDELEIMAEECYLTYESQDWCKAKYWPALVMRWLLYRAKKDNKLPLPERENYRKRILGDY